MRSLLVFLLIACCVACRSGVSTEQRLREVEARAESAEKKLAALEKGGGRAAGLASAGAAGTESGGGATGVAGTGGAGSGVAGVGSGAAGVGSAAGVAVPGGSPEPPAAVPVVHTVAAGTALVVRTTSLLSTKTARANQGFVAHLEQPLMAGGVVIAPRGARVSGVITQVDRGGRVKGKASLAVTLVSLTDQAGRAHRIATSTDAHVAKSGVKGDVVKTGVASGIGAAIGAIAGGGKGAAIGAGAGAGGGGAVVLATRGPAAEIAPESVLRFTLSRPLQVR